MYFVVRQSKYLFCSTFLGSVKLNIKIQEFNENSFLICWLFWIFILPEYKIIYVFSFLLDWAKTLRLIAHFSLFIRTNELFGRELLHSRQSCYASTTINHDNSTHSWFLILSHSYFRTNIFNKPRFKHRVVVCVWSLKIAQQFSATNLIIIKLYKGF